MVHEFGHGISKRLVGGGSASCLTSPESLGLGEGWSDAFAEFVIFLYTTFIHRDTYIIIISSWMAQASANTRDFTLGTYLASNPKGYRKYPYSTDP